MTTLEKIKEIRKILEKCWSEETSFYGDLCRTCKLKEDHPIHGISDKCHTFMQVKGSRGQCYVSSLIVQDILGGKIVNGIMNGESHYWNRLTDGIEYDVTSDQYGGDGINPVAKAIRVVSPNRRNRRYKVLKEKFNVRTEG